MVISWDVEVALLPGNRLAIAGSFRHFAGFSRNNAILNSSGQPVTHLGFESFAVSNRLDFGVLAEPEVPFEILTSSNLTDWQSLYTNTIHQPFTNLALPLSAQDHQFFRIRQP
jgi:hypothetical protein